MAFGDDPTGKFTKYYSKKYGKPSMEEMKTLGPPKFKNREKREKRVNKYMLAK